MCLKAITLSSTTFGRTWFFFVMRMCYGNDLIRWLKSMYAWKSVSVNNVIELSELSITYFILLLPIFLLYAHYWSEPLRKIQFLPIRNDSNFLLLLLGHSLKYGC